MSFSDSPNVCPTISLGVQSRKVAGAGGGIAVAASSINGFGCELSSQSSDFACAVTRWAVSYVICLERSELVIVRVMNAVRSEVVDVARFARAVAVSCCISDMVTSSSCSHIWWMMGINFPLYLYPLLLG